MNRWQRTRHGRLGVVDSNRPVGSSLRRRLATATTREFERVTDEGTPAPLTIQWHLAEFSSGVSVQRGETAQTPIPLDFPITPGAAVNQAFVAWSKSGENFETTFNREPGRGGRPWA